MIGMDFAQLHALFDQFADQTREYMDLIAERAVTIGGTARGTIQAAVEQSVLPPFPLDDRDEMRLVAGLSGGSMRSRRSSARRWTTARTRPRPRISISKSSAASRSSAGCFRLIWRGDEWARR